MKPRVAELVGLPGVGKSTLVKTLQASDPQRIAAERVDRLAYFHRIIRNALVVSVPFGAQYSRLPRPRVRKFLRMVQLATYYDLVMAYRPLAPELLLLDQGPVYLLSLFQKWQAPSPASNSRVFERYWETTLARWAEALDLVVVLEVSDDVLYERIHARDKQHRVRRMDRAQARAYFQQSRASYDLILRALQQQKNAPAVLQIDTGSMSVPATVARVREMLLPPGLPSGSGV